MGGGDLRKKRRTSDHRLACMSCLDGPKCLIRPKPNGHPGSDSGYRGQTNGRSNNSNRGKGSYKGQNNNPKDNSAKGNNRSQTGARPENGASTARPKKKKSIRNVHKKKQK